MLIIALNTKEDIPENAATFNLNTKALRQGKTRLSQKQIRRIAFILATDLNPRSLNPKEYKDGVPIFEKIKALN